MTVTPIAPEDLTTLKARHEIPQPSRWPHHQPMTPALLPFLFGNGLQPVLLSFFAAPELNLIVLFDDRYVLDLPTELRCHGTEAIRSFRDALDPLIYPEVEEHIKPSQLLSPHRLTDLQEEIPAENPDEDDLDTQLWRVILASGGTWLPA